MPFRCGSVVKDQYINFYGDFDMLVSDVEMFTIFLLQDFLQFNINTFHMSLQFYDIYDSVYKNSPIWPLKNYPKIQTVSE